jgi:spore coat polysaccharide biosynthesis protein SpsF
MPKSKSRRVVAIIQARMGSSRLPGKVLLDIHGAPMLLRVAQRVAGAKTIDQVVVATSASKDDDPVAEICRREGLACFRGHATDVLDRVHAAAEEHGANVVVRITGDCPVIDPQVIDQTVQAFLESDPPVDLALNRFVDDRTFPIGLDTEVCSYEALDTAWKHADKGYQREHVMPFLYDPPGRFRVLHVRSDGDFGGYRWTVDTPEDLAFVRAVYAHFAPDETFGWRDILELVRARPDLAALNANVQHKPLRSIDERSA